jgi:hypothetical protein
MVPSARHLREGGSAFTDRADTVTGIARGLLQVSGCPVGIIVGIKHYAAPDTNGAPSSSVAIGAPIPCDTFSSLRRMSANPQQYARVALGVRESHATYTRQDAPRLAITVGHPIVDAMVCERSLKTSGCIGLTHLCFVSFG